jgi:hypothetical protein
MKHFWTDLQRNRQYKTKKLMIVVGTRLHMCHKSTQLYVQTTVCTPIQLACAHARTECYCLGGRKYKFATNA